MRVAGGSCATHSAAVGPGGAVVVVDVVVVDVVVVDVVVVDVVVEVVVEVVVGVVVEVVVEDVVEVELVVASTTVVVGGAAVPDDPQPARAATTNTAFDNRTTASAPHPGPGRTNPSGLLFYAGRHAVARRRRHRPGTRHLRAVPRHL
jgi:hypothetical protein